MIRPRLPVLAGIAAALALAAPAPADPGGGHGQPPGQSKTSGQGQGKGHGQGSLVVADATASGPAPAVATASSRGDGNGNGKGDGGAKYAAQRAVQPAAVAPATTVAAPGNGNGHAKAAKVSELAAASTVQPAVAAPQPAPVAVAPVVAPSVPATPAPATRPVGSRAGRVVVAAHRRQRALRVARTAVARRSPAAVALPAPALGRPVAGAPRPAKAHPQAARRPARVTQEAPASLPIVRTVDRILRVIPGWIELLLAGAAACGLLLAGAALLQTRRARRLATDRERLAADVGLLQAALLPPLPARIGGTRVSAAYRPAEGLAAGGDFFDVFELPGGRTALILGDMAGHGREIVPFTALVRYSLRAYLEAGLEPRIALQLAGAALEPQLAGHLVTATVAVFDPQDGLLTYACAGHTQPLLGPGAPRPVIAASSPPIGAGYPTGRRQTTLPLAPGWGACFWTDGVADVRVGDHRLGLEGLAALHASLGPRADAAALLAAAVDASDAQPDDMAVCLLAPEREPRAAASAAGAFEELELDDEMLADGRAERFLAGCAVGTIEAADVLRTAGELVARAGSAILEVRRTNVSAEVHVRSPRVAMLPVARRDRHAGDLALAAARS